MAIDFEVEGLLEGLDGPAREARRELLEELERSGCELDELRLATEERRLPLVPVERELGGEARYTLDEMAERSELEPEFVDRLRRALGVAGPEPGERAFNEDDLEAAKRAKVFREAGLKDEDIFEISRATSRAMATVAATTGRVFTDTFLHAGDDERELALRYARASRELIPLLGPVLEYILSLQHLNLIRQAAVDASALESGHLPGSEEMCICFADLVGFTKLGEVLDPEALGAVAARLEEMADEVSSPEVRLIKTIGDEVMLASREVDSLLEACLRLVEAADAEGEGFPRLRAGIAVGEVIGRGGDWFGRPVNLASRITDVARPGSVLSAGSVKEAAEEDFSWSFAGKRRLKGIDGETSLFRVRAAESTTRAEASGRR